MFLGGPGEIKRCACGWSRVVQISLVLSCLSYELLATLQGVYSARKRPAKDERGENRLAPWSFKPPRMHKINFSAPFPVVKQKHVAGNKVANSYLKIWNNDDRDFTPKMTFFRTLEILWELGCLVNPLGRTKPPKQKSVQLEQLGGWAHTKWLLFYHTCWKSNSIKNSSASLGNFQIPLTIHVFR